MKSRYAVSECNFFYYEHVLGVNEGEKEEYIYIYIYIVKRKIALADVLLSDG